MKKRFQTYLSNLKEIETSGYEFRKFSGSYPKDRQSYIVHNVLTSPQIAEEMAESETEKDILGSYFIDFQSSYFNPISKSTTDSVKRIIDLGHEVGLFVEPLRLKEDRGAYLKQLNAFEKIFEDYYMKQLQWVCFPIRVLEEGMPEYLESCNHIFRDMFFYINRFEDSRNGWRRNPIDFISVSSERPPINLIVHPVNWV